ncbi:hypothetical protein K456DRAFT_860743 [Colletotrichum gloeosporioides 23]|nr:hypothetical protein K456DRAFT_860743 [Colletotrichum gloeosporioides 23]
MEPAFCEFDSFLVPTLPPGIVTRRRSRALLEPPASKAANSRVRPSPVHGHAKIVAQPTMGYRGGLDSIGEGNWGVLRDGKSSASSLLDGTTLTLLEICGLPVWKRKRGTGPEDEGCIKTAHESGSRPSFFCSGFFFHFRKLFCRFLPFPRLSTRPANPRVSSFRHKKQRATICFENLALFLITSRIMHCISGETGLRACLSVFMFLCFSRALSNHMSIRVGSTLMTPVARFYCLASSGRGNSSSSSYHLSSYHQTHISYSGV